MKLDDQLKPMDIINFLKEKATENNQNDLFSSVVTLDELKHNIAYEFCTNA